MPTLDWIGKQAVVGHHRRVPYRLLHCDRALSAGDPDAGNLLVQGDNLEALKALLPYYAGQVKCIYIDPPYNTGKDFVYPDNYGEGLDTYLQRTQQKDADGFWKSTNSETSGRKHANWLSMMAPRLTLARNLLRDDGVILISIDDVEVANLRLLCEEILGAENFIEQVVWKNKYNSGALTRGFSSIHEYLLVYSKTPIEDIAAPLDDDQRAAYKHEDENVATRGKYLTQPLATRSKDDRPNLVYPLVHNGEEIWPDKQWIWAKERLQKAYDAGQVVIKETGGKHSVRVKQYLRDEAGRERLGKPLSIMTGPFNQEGNKEIESMFGGRVFSFPKPKNLVQYFAACIINNDESNSGIYMDFFAGSGTTGHAVMAQNAEDGGNRRYICVQLPEPLDEPVTLDDGVVCETIFDLTRERLKRAGRKVKQEAGLGGEASGGLDTGFRVFKLDSSNFSAWNGDPSTSEADLLERLDQLADHTVPGRSETDILWEMLLKMGLPLDLKLERFEVVGAPGSEFIGVNDRTRVVSVQPSIPTEAFEALLDPPEGGVPPAELVVLDSAFADDTARANVATLYKQRADEDGKPVCNLKVV